MNSSKKAIHICHMTSVHPVTDIRIFAKQCLSLAKAGYTVSLIAPGTKIKQKNGVKIIGISSPKRGRLFRMTVTVWRVFREALKEHALTYHFHDPELIPAGLLLRILGKKVIYDVHEDYPLNIKSRYWLPLWTRKTVAWIFEHFENFFARYFNCIVSATPAIAKKFESINKNTAVVQNFPQLDELSASEKENSWQDRLNAVTYVGAIDYSRGIREIVEAIGLVKKKHNARLILAGDFSPESIKNEIKTLPGWKNVEYKGFLYRDKLTELLRVVKAGLVLLHPEPEFQVSYATKLFEYMSASIPVIASDFPLWKDILLQAGCGLLVDPLDPQAIADSIVYILEHPEEAEEMGKKGRKAVEEKYNWSREEEKLLRLYMDLIK